MTILGINGGLRPGYQDVSACLIEDGKILAAVEEERLSRIKFSPGKLPYLAIKEVLSIANKNIQDVDIIAFHGSTWESNFDTKLKNYFESQFGFAPQIRRYHHHDCHAASSYFASGFDKALIITIDNSGDGISLQISKGIGDKLTVIKRFKRPNSLGIFYSLITQYCGFVRDSDEYKLMGLSSYGNRYKYEFDWLISFDKGELSLNDKFLIPFVTGQPGPHRDEVIFNDSFIEKLGNKKRIPESSFDDFYKDIAASAQEHFEQLMLKIAHNYIDQTGLKNLCLAGGAALNCVMNQKLMNSKKINALFVPPASSDSGISLGAAWLASLEQNIYPAYSSTPYLGRNYSNKDVMETLNDCQIKYDVLKDASAKAAELISKNKIIGWFQGGAEFGPRALGNRSILANALQPNMQNIVNRKIKLRESFRPFCPSVLEEDFSLYFEGAQTISPFMNITYSVIENQIKTIPAVVHVDGTARIQTVNSKQNEKYYQLLKKLKKLTGHGIVLNTSFNLSHEPMVYSCRNALATFYSSGLDYLIINDYLISKQSNE